MQASSCADYDYEARSDISGSFDERQAACVSAYPGGPGLATVHSEAQMSLAKAACGSGTCMLGLRWHDSEWRWVDGVSAGRNGRSSDYQRWAGGQGTPKDGGGETTAAFGDWGDGLEWHDAGTLATGYGVTLCKICASTSGPQPATPWTGFLLPPSLRPSVPPSLPPSLRSGSSLTGFCRW